MNLISPKAFKSVTSVAAATAFAFSGIAAASPQAEAASKLVQVNCKKAHDIRIMVDPRRTVGVTIASREAVASLSILRELMDTSPAARRVTCGYLVLQTGGRSTSSNLTSVHLLILR